MIANCGKCLAPSVYPHASPRTELFGPPLDIEFGKPNMSRSRQLAKAMGLGVALANYPSRKAVQGGRLDVQTNTSSRV